MFSWFWKRLGYHVCEEFTEWEARTRVCERAARGDEIVAFIKKVRYTESWQERKCKVCQKIQQLPLKFGAQNKQE